MAFAWANYSEQAEMFGTALLNHIEILSKFPHIGSPVRERQGVRQLVHTPFLILYAIDEGKKSVEVLHFWHLSRRR